MCRAKEILRLPMEYITNLETELAACQEEVARLRALVSDLADHISRVVPDSSVWVDYLADRCNEALKGGRW